MASVVSTGILVSLLSHVTCIEISSLFNDQQQVLMNSRIPEKVSNLRYDEISDYLQRRRGQKSATDSAQFMLHLFKDLVHGKKLNEAVGHTDEQTSDFILHSDTIRGFSPITKSRGKYVFTVPAMPHHEVPQLVELRFNKLRKTQTYLNSISIVIRAGQQSIKRTVQYQKASVFDITNITVPFLSKFHGNITTIEIKVQYRILNGIRHGKEVRPIMVIYSQDKDFLKSIYSSYSSLTSEHEQNLSSRPKRSASGTKTGRKRKRNKWKTNEICKLHKFKVDFDLIGWGPWIVHPKKFNARVCYGQCPAPITPEYTPTNHAMLQTLMRMKRPLSAPEPCCVPTKLRPLSMLYYEYDDIVVRHHQEMIAAECGCR